VASGISWLRGETSDPKKWDVAFGDLFVER